MKHRLLLLSAMIAAPAWAQDSLSPLGEESDHPILETPRQVPTPPPANGASIVVPKDWRGVFDAIRAENWKAVSAGIAALPDDLLKPVAKAELYTARNSPKVEAPALVALLTEAPELPQAEQLQRMAATRGIANPPTIIAPRRLAPLQSAPRRHRSAPVTGDPVADQLRTALDPLVKSDSAPEAEALYSAAAPTLSAEARAEAAQRVAWIYYVIGRDADAQRVAEDGLAGASGEWAVQAQWIAGLASWRQENCTAAATHFRAVAGNPRAESELRAAGAYWAARSEQACRRPGAVEPLLRLAAASPESFYGLIARETLGMTKGVAKSSASGTQVDRLVNVRRASELVRIGERSLAGEMLRHQARIGNPAEHAALVAKARELDLPAIAYWLAHNGPPGTRLATDDRFPLPRWAPREGWRIEPAWAYAHVRQESDFRTAAVSPAGAVGLMQVRPGTAGDFARARGTDVGTLSDPATNLEYGQSFIEMMRRHPSTQGQMLKIIAAYNAGPLPVGRWASINDKGDPLLWIESLPYWETRYYVPAVLRNMWIYEEFSGERQTALKSIAEHHWPQYPSR